MGFNCGIIGLPNVGKSTLFSALTKIPVGIENYPFCTIEPNIGITPVPDHRLEILGKLVSTQKIIPAAMHFVDIAGLVKGASQGEGLGNQFLSNIRQTDAIIHVVRCFESSNITHVSGKVNPEEDVEVINLELLLADLGLIEKAIEKASKLLKSGDKNLIQKLDTLSTAKQLLLNNTWLSQHDWEEKEQMALREYGLITLKPLLYVANSNEENLSENNHLKALKKIAEQTNAKIIPVCAELEKELTELEEEEKSNWLETLGWQESGLNQIARSGYELLGLQTFFTAGKQEVKAWTIRQGDTAFIAAGKIHKDFQKGFCRAEVIGYDDYIESGSEAHARATGKLRLEGKNYQIVDGDVLHFLFNV